MKIMVFDVGNASCNLIVDDNGKAMLIDAGSNTTKACPIDIIYAFKDKYLKLQQTEKKPIIHNLTITHPDDDHIRNLDNIMEHFDVNTLKRNCHIEDYKKESLSDGDSIEFYKTSVCEKYRNPVPKPLYLFNYIYYQIPIEYVNKNFTDSKITNNSSVVALIEYQGKKILFGGDLEEDGREYLIDNNHEGFVDKITKGIDLFVVPHHGHKSGYSKKLFETMGDVKLSVLSKGSEFEKEGTDVSSSYISHSSSHNIYNLNGEYLDSKKTLTTRNNGLIIIEIDKDGNVFPLVEKQGN